MQRGSAVRARRAHNPKVAGSIPAPATVSRAHTCAQCHELRDSALFAPSVRNASGVNSYCRECRARLVREARQRRTEAEVAADRAAMRERYAAQPEMWKAKVAVSRAVAAGRLTRAEACDECGTSTRRIEAHHTSGYAREQWLTVTWVCRPCHRRLHGRCCA